MASLYLMLQAKLVFNVINACTLSCRSIVEACSEGHFNEMSAVSFGFQKCSCEGQVKIATRRWCQIFYW